MSEEATSEVTTEMGQVIRLVSHNVNASTKECGEFTWVKRRDEIVQLHRQLKTDIICLQEVIVDSQRNLNYVKDLKDALGGVYDMFMVDFPTDRFDSQNLVTLVRRDVFASVECFSARGDAPDNPHRYVDKKMNSFQVLKVVTHEGQVLFVGNNHFHSDNHTEEDIEESRRWKSAKALGGFMAQHDENLDSKCLIVGDFNKFANSGGVCIDATIRKFCNVVDLYKGARSVSTGELATRSFKGFARWDFKFNHIHSTPDGVYGRGVTLAQPVQVVDMKRVTIDEKGLLEANNWVSDHAALFVAFRMC